MKNSKNKQSSSKRMCLQRGWNVTIEKKPDEMTKVFENNDRLGNCTATKSQPIFID